MAHDDPLAPDAVATLRAAMTILEQLARQAKEAAHRASSPAVCAREHNRASELWRAARTVEREAFDDERRD